MPISLPHWEYGDDREERIRRVHENFEEVVSQTEKQMRDSFVHEPQEALGVVTTTSATYVALSGNPSITVQCRAGLMVAVLMDAEVHGTSGDSAVIAGELDSSGTYVGGLSSSSTTYVRRLSSAIESGTSTIYTGGAYPAGSISVFPATATSHTITMKYLSLSGSGLSASFKNRRIWAWVF